MNIVGCPMFILNKKLQLLKGKLKHWNSDIFGDVHNQVNINYDVLSQIQELIWKEGANEALISQEKKAQVNLAKALGVEEIFWKEKSRLSWHLDGDGNTS